MDNVTYECNIDPFSVYGHQATLNVANSSVKAGVNAHYAISTNAGNESNYGAVVAVKNSTIDSVGTSSKSSIAILFNIPGDLTIENSLVKGELNAVVARGGDVSIKGSTLENHISDEDWNELKDYFDTHNWGAGNMVPFAALTIGNKTPNAYQYPVHCTVESTKIVTGEGQRTVHINGNSTAENGAYLEYDADSNLGTIDVGGGYVSINDRVAVVDEAGLQSALDQGKPVVLGSDITLTKKLSASGKVDIDGDEKSIVFNVPGVSEGSAISVSGSENVSIRNCVFGFDQFVRNPLSISAGGVVTIEGNTFNCGKSMCYNPIEFGIGDKAAAPASGTSVSNNVFTGVFKNNGISFYKLVEGGLYTVSGNTFEYAANGLRLSNPLGVHATFNVAGNEYKATSEGEYAGFLLFQDYGAADAHQDLSALTVNISGLIGPHGKAMTDNETNGQVYYVYSDNGGGLNCSELSTAHPVVVFA